jgi:glutaryl-CoA dehydrogenase
VLGEAARDVADKQVKAFVVEKDNPGYKATKIEGKLSLRMVRTPISRSPIVGYRKMRVCRTATRLRTAYMLGDVTAMQLYCIRLGRLIDDGKLEETMAALAKYYCSVKAREACGVARDVLGGNGITLDFHVMRHMCDMESLVTYEGTAEIQSLIVGRDITGQSAFA